MIKSHENNRDKFNTRNKDKRHQGRNEQEGTQTSINLMKRNFDQISSSSGSDEESSAILAMVMKNILHGDSSTWMLDCGSTTHVCVERDRFTNLKKSNAQFTVWTG